MESMCQIKPSKWRKRYDLFVLSLYKNITSNDDLSIRIVNNLESVKLVKAPNSITDLSSIRVLRVISHKDYSKDISMFYDAHIPYEIIEINERQSYNFLTIIRQIKDRKLRHLLRCLSLYNEDFMGIYGDVIVGKEHKIDGYSFDWGKTFMCVKQSNKMYVITINNFDFNDNEAVEFN